MFDALQIRALIGLNDKPIEGAGVCVIVSGSVRECGKVRKDPQRKREERKRLCACKIDG